MAVRILDFHDAADVVGFRAHLALSCVKDCTFIFFVPCYCLFHWSYQMGQGDGWSGNLWPTFLAYDIWWCRENFVSLQR